RGVRGGPGPAGARGDTLGARLSRTRRIDPWLAAFAGVALVYLGVRLAAFLPTSPRDFPDSGTYVRGAHLSLLSKAFLAGGRPPTLPFLYKVLPDDDGWRTAAQLAVSIASWLALAATVAWSTTRRWVGLTGFCLVLAFSCTVWVTQWDSVVLSESLSIS